MKQPEFTKTELIVVLHGPHSNAERLFPDRVKVLRIESESLSDARNMGWEHAEGDIVAFVDDDAEASPNWLATILSHFENRDLMSLGGLDRPHPDDSSFARAARLQENFFRLYLLGLKSESLRYKGANLVVRTTLIEQIGGFHSKDEYYGAEDTALVNRVLAAGFSARFDPALVVYHHGPTLRQVVRKRAIEIRGAGAPAGLRTPLLAGIYLGGLLLVAIFHPTLLLAYILLGILVWLALGISVIMTQAGRLSDLPGVLLMIGLEFAFLPLRGLASRRRTLPVKGSSER